MEATEYYTRYEVCQNAGLDALNRHAACSQCDRVIGRDRKYGARLTRVSRRVAADVTFFCLDCLAKMTD